MGKHYKYGGSTAKRTLNCPRWKALSEKGAKVPDKSSTFADRGTMLHLACETLTKKPALEFEDLLALDIHYEGWKLTEELLYTKVVPAYDEAEAIFDIYNCIDVESELVVSLDDNIGGTIDLAGLSEDRKTLVLPDYKFGEGLMVYAEDNAQLFFYAWCTLFSERGATQYPDVEKVVLGIVQPSDKRDSYSDIVEVTVDEVDEFGQKMDKAIAIAEACYDTPDGTDHLAEGDWCKYCPNVLTCPVKLGTAEEALAISSGSSDFSDDIAYALDLADKLKPWIKDVFSRAQELAEDGVEVTDWKIVAKRATRKWEDEERAGVFLKRYLKAKNAFVRKPISPTVAEQTCKRLDVDFDKYFQKHIVKASSGNTLVRESDKRPAVEKLDTSALKSIFEK